jgi:hypothetical protein
MPDKNDSGVTGKVVIIGCGLLGLALVISSLVVRSTIVKVKGYGRTIRVTGAAFEPIRSDYAVWEGFVNVTSSTLEDASAKMQRDLAQVHGFLGQRGFDSSQYDVGEVRINKNFGRERQLLGYTLRRRVRLELPDVDRVARLAKDASSLIEKGMEFESVSPRFLFTGLDTLKIEMIRRATENAKLRAQQLAETTGRAVGAPTSAGVGVFQIRPLHSQEVRGYGMNDVTSIEKEIMSTVHISFMIE